MFELRLPPEFEVGMYKSYEKELVKRLELRRVAHLEKTRQPSVVDETLLLAGNSLIAFGRWIRARSAAAELAS